jgi:plasmid stabilization system protein ParE
VKHPFVLTPEAESDLLAIWEYVADHQSESSADQVIARIYDACEELSAMPGMGHVRPELLDDRHRFWTVWSYLIVYRWQTHPLQVIAIVHGARELESFFEDRQITE